EISVTQRPNAKSAKLGEDVTINFNMNCKASSSITGDYNYLAWYQQRVGESPKLLIYRSSTLQTRISSRFNGSGSGLDYMLTISNVQPEDAGHYYCQQAVQKLPLHVDAAAKSINEKDYSIKTLKYGNDIIKNVLYVTINHKKLSLR
uniref:Ig-like domain-containing protein n=1 Tax=Erpetoichthys calabaricus TaxID=27687 RepID=A0A8C4REM9_ERPCA